MSRTHECSLVVHSTYETCDLDWPCDGISVSKELIWLHGLGEDTLYGDSFPTFPLGQCKCLNAFTFTTTYWSGHDDLEYRVIYIVTKCICTAHIFHFQCVFSVIVHRLIALYNHKRGQTRAIFGAWGWWKVKIYVEYKTARQIFSFSELGRRLLWCLAN